MAARLVTACVASIAVALLMFTGVAHAHVEVLAEPAIAGSTDATVTFLAEAESATAGIASVRIVLPAAIATADVALAQAPPGWTLTPTEDGYSVGGAALPVREEAVHTVQIARLPDETRLVFKALVTYADGDVDRWIEEPTDANPQPDNPAPVLELEPGPRPGPATSAAPTLAPAPPSAAATPPAPSGGAIVADEDAGSGGGAGWIWWLLAALLVAAGAVAGILAARRRAGPKAS